MTKKRKRGGRAVHLRAVEQVQPLAASRRRLARLAQLGRGSGSARRSRRAPCASRTAPRRVSSRRCDRRGRSSPRRRSPAGAGAGAGAARGVDVLDRGSRRRPTSRGRRASSTWPCAPRRRRPGPARRCPRSRRRARAPRRRARPPRARAAPSSTRSPAAAGACGAGRRCRRARTSCSPRTSTVSIASRVVPGHLGDDHALLAEQRVQERRLADVRPAEDGDADRLLADRRRGRRPGSSVDDLVEQVAGAVAVQRRERRPGRRGRAGGTRAPPRRAPGRRSCSRAASTGLCERAQDRASSSSPGVMPARASTTKSTRSASATAARACSAIERVIGDGSAMSTPPVSIEQEALARSTRRRAPCGRASTPGVSWTTAARVAVRRLTSVDLPTFGKPTIATVPSECSRCSAGRLALTTAASPGAGRPLARASRRGTPTAAGSRARSRADASR